ncbi:MAG TPA: cache domain-containing protein [Rhodopila sp.]
MPAAIILGVAAIGALANAHTPEQAQMLAERAVAHIQAVGREQAFSDFSRPDGGFVEDELYVFCWDVSGVVVAHGGNPRTVGHSWADLRGADGGLLIADLNQFVATRGSGWVQFRWPNPLTRRIELKTAYVLRADDRTVCGSGFYKGTPQ